MARYVVVEFEDNAEAEKFIERVYEECKFSRQDRLSFRRRIVGVFVKPGRTCVCYGWEKGNSGAKDWPIAVALGEKFGWWVCTACNKPRRGGHQLNNQLDMADTYEGVVHDNFEFGVTSIDITGISHGSRTSEHGVDITPAQVKRHKRLRPKKKKG